MSERANNELAADLRWLIKHWKMAPPSVRRKIEAAFRSGRKVAGRL